MTDTKVSLFSRIKTQKNHHSLDRCCCTEATEARPREKRDERKLLLEPWIQPHLKSGNRVLPSLESHTIPLFCFKVFEHSDKWIITNSPK